MEGRNGYLSLRAINFEDSSTRKRECFTAMHNFSSSADGTTLRSAFSVRSRADVCRDFGSGWSWHAPLSPPRRAKVADAMIEALPVPQKTLKSVIFPGANPDGIFEISMSTPREMRHSPEGQINQQHALLF